MVEEYQVGSLAERLAGTGTGAKKVEAVRDLVERHNPENRHQLVQLMEADPRIPPGTILKAKRMLGLDDSKPREF